MRRSQMRADLDDPPEATRELCCPPVSGHAQHRVCCGLQKAHHKAQACSAPGAGEGPSAVTRLAFLDYSMDHQSTSEGAEQPML